MELLWFRFWTHLIFDFQHLDGVGELLRALAGCPLYIVKKTQILFEFLPPASATCTCSQVLSDMSAPLPQNEDIMNDAVCGAGCIDGDFSVISSMMPNKYLVFYSTLLLPLLAMWLFLIEAHYCQGDERKSSKASHHKLHISLCCFKLSRFFSPVYPQSWLV